MLKTMPGKMPPAPPLKKLLGPSFILLGLGLGSGEIILWPYLSANWGLGIAWGALLGILFQFFINLEIERYSLIKGESVFFGLKRKWKYVPHFLILSTLISFGWPGIIASSSVLISSILKINSTTLAIILLIFIGIILSSGKYIYRTVENFSKLIIMLGVPLIFILTIYITKSSDWSSLASGLIGKGDGYWFFPAGLPLASFLAAFAFSGAGGNLNLSQSSYIREKGYGMGSFMPKIKGLLSNHKENIDLQGFEFEPTPENVINFQKWWKKINLEHFLVFFLTGFLAISFLLVLSYSTAHSIPNKPSGIGFVLVQAKAIGEIAGGLISKFFLIILGIMLFSTQFTVLDSTSRIMSENYATINPEKKINLSKTYYGFLWGQILLGIIIFSFGLQEPLTLLTLSAVINAICMFIHIGLVNILNHQELPKEVRPKLWRKLVILIAFIFFGVFSGITIWDKLF